MSSYKKRKGKNTKIREKHVKKVKNNNISSGNVFRDIDKKEERYLNKQNEE